MPLPPQVISHGALEEQIGGLRWRRRLRDFDSCTMSIDSLNPDFIVPGSPLPGHPLMRAVEVQPEEQGDVWVFNNTEYRGFKNATETWRKFSQSKNSPSEGFDNISISIGTTEPNHPRFKRGEKAPTADGVPAEYPFMFIMDVASEETDITDTQNNSLFSILNLALRGIMGDKPYTRRVNGATQTIQPEGTWAIETSINELGEPIAGYVGSHLVEISLAKLQVTDSFVTTTTPPFGGLPGSITPPDAPDFTDFDFWTTGTVRYHWPHGWRRATITSEKLPGKNVWFWSVTYEYQQKILPT